MKKSFKKFGIIAILIVLSMSVIGCNSKEKQETINQTGNNSSIENGLSDDNNLAGGNALAGNGSFTIADIKNEFSALGTSSNYTFKPFYNVEQTTEFTFHFNSMVDPIKAITVHTDSKCEESSTVFQLNDGYKVENGIDVVVKPRKAVLGEDARKNAVKDGIWGYAPIYYLCIRYDLDSTEVRKLDEPIVIPFTIKNEISTPNAYAHISNDGTFFVRWFDVEEAVSYNIYRSFFGSIKKETKEMTREECAYMGEVVKLVKNVDASTLEFIEATQSSIELNILSRLYVLEAHLQSLPELFPLKLFNCVCGGGGGLS